MCVIVVEVKLLSGVLFFAILIVQFEYFFWLIISCFCSSFAQTLVLLLKYKKLSGEISSSVFGSRDSNPPKKKKRKKRRGFPCLCVLLLNRRQLVTR